MVFFLLFPDNFIYQLFYFFYWSKAGYYRLMETPVCVCSIQHTNKQVTSSLFLLRRQTAHLSHCLIDGWWLAAVDNHMKVDHSAPSPAVPLLALGRRDERDR